MVKTRIKESIGNHGENTYTPQSKWLGLFWMSFTDHLYSPIQYTQKHLAENYLAKLNTHTVGIKYHEQI